MTDTLIHRPEVGIHFENGRWVGACACGQWFDEASRSAARRVSHAHYNLADLDVELPFTPDLTVVVSEDEADKAVFSAVITDEGRVILTAFVNGEPETIDESHPNFARILAALRSNGDVGDLLSHTTLFENLDAKVEVRDDGVYYGDWAIHNSLTATIERYQQEGRDTSGLVKFMERLMNNPSENSRDQLFTWAQAQDLTIDAEGYIIAFKAVTTDMTSRNHGTAYVDGVEHHGAIPYPIGSVVSMPREDVVDDPTVACNRGLHVGTLRYARTFGPPVIIQVQIDPADCVSVPGDSNFEKMRVCKLKVLSKEVREVVKESDLWVHEPPAQEFEDTFDQLAEEVPMSWIERMRARRAERRRGRVEESVDV